MSSISTDRATKWAMCCQIQSNALSDLHDTCEGEQDRLENKFDSSSTTHLETLKFTDIGRGAWCGLHAPGSSFTVETLEEKHNLKH